MNRKAIPVVIAALAVILSGTACSVSTEPDEVAVVYNKGPVAATQWQEQVNPGSRAWVDPFDESYPYPAGQRTWAFTGLEGADRATISVADQDGITLDIPGTARFALNTDPETLKQFHEKIGLNYQDNWKGLLGVYLDTPLNRAVTEATQGFTWRDLYQDPTAKAAWEKKAKELLPDFIKQAGGGEFFNGIDLTLQKPVLPPQLTDRLLGVETAKAALDQQEAENAVVASKAIGEQKLVDLYGKDNYALLKAIESGKVEFMQLPAGAGVSIAPR
nr:SPFH domain-containing protein [Rhodococcus sp. (in: high G+C Gram-positive bacteria)]